MPRPRIIGIVGPKGGVGKTTLSGNLALDLTRIGARVVVMDLDLGSANLHVIFGLKNVPRTLDDFLLNKVAGLEEVLLPTGLPNLHLIAGGNVPGIAALPYQRKLKLVRHLEKLPCDFVILDLSPGASHNMADFALIAWKCLLVTTPDVPSLMSLYSFIKTAAHRRLTLFFRQSGAEDLSRLLERAKDVEANPDLKTMRDFHAQAEAVNPVVARQARELLDRLGFLIAVNRVRTDADLKAGQAIRQLMADYLDLTVARDALFRVREDPAVNRAAARLTPVLLSEPDCPFAQDIRVLVRALTRHAAHE